MIYIEKITIYVSIYMFVWTMAQNGRLNKMRLRRPVSTIESVTQFSEYRSMTLFHLVPSTFYMCASHSII